MHLAAHLLRWLLKQVRSKSSYTFTFWSVTGYIDQDESMYMFEAGSNSRSSSYSDHRWGRNLFCHLSVWYNIMLNMKYIIWRNTLKKEKKKMFFVFTFHHVYKHKRKKLHLTTWSFHIVKYNKEKSSYWDRRYGLLSEWIMFTQSTCEKKSWIIIKLYLQVISVSLGMIILQFNLRENVLSKQKSSERYI